MLSCCDYLTSCTELHAPLMSSTAMTNLAPVSSEASTIVTTVPSSNASRFVCQLCIAGDHVYVTMCNANEPSQNQTPSQRSITQRAGARLVLTSIVLINIRTESIHWACCRCFSQITGSRGPNQHSQRGLPPGSYSGGTWRPPGPGTSKAGRVRVHTNTLLS